jgi:hypothetical protein
MADTNLFATLTSPCVIRDVIARAAGSDPLQPHRITPGWKEQPQRLLAAPLTSPKIR